jgi:hypothetical protein
MLRPLWLVPLLTGACRGRGVGLKGGDHVRAYVDDGYFQPWKLNPLVRNGSALKPHAPGKQEGRGLEGWGEPRRRGRQAKKWKGMRRWAVGMVPSVVSTRDSLWGSILSIQYTCKSHNSMPHTRTFQGRYGHVALPLVAAGSAGCGWVGGAHEPRALLQ